MENFQNLESSIDRHFAQAIAWRRHLHKYPQPAWLEFLATGLIAEKLSEWGYEVTLGADIVDPDKLLLRPERAKLEEEYQRSLRLGVKEQYIAPAKEGCTGVVGVLRGSQPGPCVGFRFDIDCNEVTESVSPEHRPAREGFASQIPGCAHMCGHDVHAAIGLLLARYFAENRDGIKGSVKFIFQPNEENLSGAAAMVSAGVLDDVDYLLGGHVGICLKQTGQIAFNVNSFYALSRFEVTYRGRAAHAAVRPDEGKNALLGACAAITNLHAIARHGAGASRINVGTMQAGATWNVVPEIASFRMETRGVSDEINQFMVQKTQEILTGAAKMYDLELEVRPGAISQSGANSAELVATATELAEKLPFISEVVSEASLHASEDVTVMMERVQSRGGKAMFGLFGTPTGGGHHNPTFDVDERVIANAAKFLAALQQQITG